jgi:coproporphyrinogen III oxidase
LVVLITDIENNKKISSTWFKELRNQMVGSIEKIDGSRFKEKIWERQGGGGGLMSTLKGNVFEKVGVNISTVHGKFTEEFRKNMPGTDDNPSFWASGISGGGCDLTPAIPEDEETNAFHSGLEKTCNQHDRQYYPKFKKECDEYFFLKHRDEKRGIGGIFFDYLNTSDFEKDLNFIKDVGQFFANFVNSNTLRKKDMNYNEEDIEKLSHKRSRYVEFNLLYDRGTLFGLKTGGNIDAILMSMPPEAKWK